MATARKSAFALKDKYATVGVGNTDYTSNSGRTVRSLAIEAAGKAIADAGLKPSDVDGLVSYNFNDSVPAISVATGLGIRQAGYAVDFLAGGNAANLIVLSAIAAIEAGLADVVVCYRAMNGRAGFRLGGDREFRALGRLSLPRPSAGSPIRRPWPCGAGAT